MSKITELTDEQWAEVHAAREKWLSIGRSTEPCDREKAQSGITWLYENVLDKEAPKFFWWDSPWSACVGTPLLLAAIGGAENAKQLYSQLSSQLDSQLYSQLYSRLRSRLRSQLYSRLSSQLDSQLRSRLGSQLSSQLRSRLGSQLSSQLDSQLGSQLGSQLYSQLNSQLYSQLRSQLNSQLYSQLGSQLYSQLGSQLDSQLDSQLGSQLGSQLDSQLSSQLDSQLGSQLRSLAQRIRQCEWSCRWYSWWLHNIEATRITGVKHDVGDAMIQAYVEAVGNAEWFCPFEDFVVCVERPKTLTVDGEGRLHNETGKAIEYRDAWGLSFWRGTCVPDEWIADKENLKPETALTWENIEQRRAAAEIIGWDNVIQSLNPRVIDEDPNPEIGTLVRVDLPDSPDEQFLRVKCGTGRAFALPVPPEMKTARESNAWTYGLEAKDYNLEVRT